MNYRILALLLVLSVVPLTRAGEAPLQVRGALSIDTHQAYALHQQGALFIDVRGSKQWRWGHIARAHHYDLKTTFSVLRHKGFIDRREPLVIYGNGAHTMRAALAVYLAASWGYKTVYFYRDGYYSWLMNDFPVVMKPSGSSPGPGLLSDNPS